MPADALPIPWDATPDGGGQVTATPRERPRRETSGASRTTTVRPRE